MQTSTSYNELDLFITEGKNHPSVYWPNVCSLQLLLHSSV